MILNGFHLGDSWQYNKKHCHFAVVNFMNLFYYLIFKGIKDVLWYHYMQKTYTVINILSTGLTLGLAFACLQYQDPLNYPPAKICQFYFLSIKEHGNWISLLSNESLPFFKGTDNIKTKMWWLYTPLSLFILF